MRRVAGAGADVRSVAIASDHTGPLRQDARHLSARAGPGGGGSGHGQTEPVDYPDVAATVADAVARGEADAGIVIDGAGIGSAIAANKVGGVRAAWPPRRRSRGIRASTTAPTS